MENIKISVSESGNNSETSMIRVDGVIDTLTATHLEEVLDKLLKRGRFKIILDLAGVDYISSAGWGIFISRIKEIRDNSGDIKLANMVPNVMEIYELLEFDNILAAYESLSGAKSAFGGNADKVVKKKVAVATTQTTIEELSFGAEVRSDSQTYERRQVSSAESTNNAESLIDDAIGRDPFYTISELKMILSEKMMDNSPGWWGVFKILWKKKLLSKRSRFRFARQRRYR